MAGKAKFLLIPLVAIGAFVILSRVLVPQAVVVDVKRGTAVKAVIGTIRVEPAMDSFIASPGPGKLLDSTLVEGLPVTESQTLARIDPGELPFKIKEIKLEIESIEKLLDEGHPKRFEVQELKADLARKKVLMESNRFPRAKYEAIIRSVEQLESQIRTDMEKQESQADILKNNLAKLEDEQDRLTVRAPFDGTITQLLAFPGDLLAESNPIAKIISNSVKVNAEVNEDDIDVIRHGVPAKIRFFAYGDELFDAKVNKIIGDADPETRRFKVLLDMVNPPSDLMSGITGEVTFYAGENPNAIIIPAEALLGNNVLVVANGVVEVRRVEKGFKGYSEAEIIKGLSEGEQVIVRDHENFRDGTRAKPVREHELED